MHLQFRYGWNHRLYPASTDKERVVNAFVEKLAV